MPTQKSIDYKETAVNYYLVIIRFLHSFISLYKSMYLNSIFPPFSKVEPKISLRKVDPKDLCLSKYIEDP